MGDSRAIGCAVFSVEAGEGVDAAAGVVDLRAAALAAARAAATSPPPSFFTAPI